MSLNLLSFGSLGYVFSRILKRMRPKAVIDSKIDASAIIFGGSQILSVTMGRQSYCGFDCAMQNVEIGSFCSMADRVYIGGSGHPMDFVSTSPVFLSKRSCLATKYAGHEFSNIPQTTIGHDVWIGYGAFIRAGVHVGTGAVIGMGAVVTKDVEPYAVVGGNPAREIKKRFPASIIDGLLASEWWTYSDVELRAAGADFNDPEVFLRKKGFL